MWVTKDDTGEQYTRLVINNMDNDAGDLNLTTADSAVVVGSSPSWFVSEITLVRKGALSFLPPAANVTSTFMVLVGTTNGDKSGKIRVDTRVSLNLLASPYTMLTPYVTKTYTQVGDWAFPSYDVPRFFVNGGSGGLCATFQCSDLPRCHVVVGPLFLVCARRLLPQRSVALSPKRPSPLHRWC
jgi:hypothetical protein